MRPVINMTEIVAESSLLKLASDMKFSGNHYLIFEVNKEIESNSCIAYELILNRLMERSSHSKVGKIYSAFEYKACREK